MMNDNGRQTVRTFVTGSSSFSNRGVLHDEGTMITREDVKPSSSASLLSSTSSLRGASRERKNSWEVISNSNINSNNSNSNTRSRNIITVQDLPTTRPLENEATECLLQTLESRKDLKQWEGGQPAVLSNISVEDVNALLARGWESKQQEEDSLLQPHEQHQKNSFKQLSSQAQQSSLNSIAGKDSSICSTSFSSRKQPSRSSTLYREKSYLPVARHRRIGTIGDKLELLSTTMDVVFQQNLDFVTDSTGGREDDHDENENHTDIDLDGTWKGAAKTLQQNAELIHQPSSRNNTTTPAAGGNESDSHQVDPFLLSPLTAGFNTGIQSQNGSTDGLNHPTIRNAPPRLNNYISQFNDDNGEEEVEFGDDGSSTMKSVIENVEIPSNEAMPANNTSTNDKQNIPNNNKPFRIRKSRNKFVSELNDFFLQRRKTIFYASKMTTCCIVLPCLGLAAFLFYSVDNPPTGIVANDMKESGVVNENGESIGTKSASASWWLLFLGVRQIVILAFAKASEMFLIDFLSVRSRVSVKLLGSWGTLFLLQAKGWPFLMFAWGVLNFALLSGAKPFFHHWGYWQDALDLFNQKNPSGDFVDSVLYHRLVTISVFLGCVVAAKRFWLGLFLGRQTFAQYSVKLADIMEKIILVSEVASLGRSFERQIRENELARQKRTSITAESFGLDRVTFEVMMQALPDDSTMGGYAPSEAATDEFRRVIDINDREPLTGRLTQTQKARITQILGAWEEPTVAKKNAGTRASVQELLQFRRSLEFLNARYPFSGSFGPADNRESLVSSAQDVYDRILLRSPNPFINFDVIALLGVTKDGLLNQAKLKALVKLFRPNRDGSIHCIDFVKSVDAIYQEFRLLRASVANSSKIDRAFESIFNIVFYAIVLCIILSQIGYNPLALFLSISGVILGFAFMIGTASSKYFEGLLFILVRRPYQIGDGIALSDVNKDIPGTGSPHWIVEDVDLFTTRVVYVLTLERATLNNGSLANCRVVNSTQSPHAWLYVFLKFPVSVSFEKLQTFQQSLEKYIKDRPREWLSFTQFRATRVEVDKGFVEYIVLGQHRLPWVQWGELMQSKSDLLVFSMELSKKLDIFYEKPSVPVDLHLVGATSLMDIVQTMTGAMQPPILNHHHHHHSVSRSSLPDLTELQTQFRPQFDWQQ